MNVGIIVLVVVVVLVVVCCLKKKGCCKPKADTCSKPEEKTPEQK